MPSWTSAITAADDLQDPALHGMLWGALSERWRAAFGDSPSGLAAPSSLVAPSAGTDVQAKGYFGSAGIQGYIDYLRRSGKFLDYSLASGWEGFAASTSASGFPFNGYSASGLRAAAGLAPTLRYNVVGANTASFLQSWATDGSDGPLFRRRGHRLMRNATDSYDLYGNAVATGQRAWLVDPAAGNALLRRIRCTTPGTWVDDDTTDPDVLDNTVAPPGCLAIQNSNINAGWFDTGELFGWWLFDEARLLLDQLRWVWSQIAVAGTRRQYATTASYPDRGSAQAAADAGWGGAGTSSYSWSVIPFTAGRSFTTKGWSEGTNPTCSATLTRDQGLVSPAQYQTSVLAKKYQGFAWGVAVNTPGGSGFDDNGDPIQDTAWHEWASGGPTASASIDVPFGDVTNPPHYNAGYEVIQMVLVLKFNVTGGFAYTSVTD